MTRFLKSLFLIGLYLISAYFFGLVCKQINASYSLFLIPSPAIGVLVLMFFGVFCAVALCTGLIAALFRPLWMGFLVFCAGTFALTLHWNIVFNTVLLLVAYLLGSLLFYIEAVRELSNRIKFSVRAITMNFGILFLALIFVACGNFYRGCESAIAQDGFSIPNYYIQLAQNQAEKEIKAQAPREQRTALIEKFREDFPGAVASFKENTIKPNQHLIPLALSTILFAFLMTLTSFIQPIITLLLDGILKILIGLRFAHLVPDYKEVQTLTLD